MDNKSITDALAGKPTGASSMYFKWFGNALVMTYNPEEFYKEFSDWIRGPNEDIDI